MMKSYHCVQPYYSTLYKQMIKRGAWVVLYQLIPMGTVVFPTPQKGPLCVHLYFNNEASNCITVGGLKPKTDTITS